MQNPSVSQILDRLNQDSQTSTTKKSTKTIKIKKPVKKNITSPSINRTSSVSEQQTEENFDIQWESILECVKQTFSSVKSANYETTYQLIEKLCKNQVTLQKLADKYTNTIDEYSNNSIKSILQLQNYESFENFYIELQQNIEKLETLFSTFEKSYLYPVTISKSIQNQFIKYISQNSAQQDFIITFLADGFKQNRLKYVNGSTDIKHFQIIANCSHFFEVESDLQAVIIEDATQYYQTLEVPQLDNENLINWFEKQINYEIDMYQYFKTTIGIEIIDTSRQTLYGMKFYMYLQNIISDLVFSKKYDSIVKVSKLCDYSPEMKELFTDEFKKFAKNCVSQVKKGTNVAIISDIFGKLLVFRDLKEGIENETINDAFKAFCTEMRSKYRKLQLMYAEFINQKIQEDDFPQHLSDYILFFRQLSSIDEFVLENRSYLVNRLLSPNYSHISNEEIFGKAIEEIIGSDGIKSTFQMISDVKYSRSMDIKLSIPGFVTLIKYDTWPEYQEIFPEVPRQIEVLRKEFENQFHEENKKISWVSPLETVDFEYGNAKISGSLTHLCALMKISEGNDKIPKDIKEQLVAAKILDENNMISTEGNFILPLPKYRIPDFHKEENSYEAQQNRKDRIIARIVLIAKKTKEVPKHDLEEQLKQFISELTEEEIINSINNAVKREYISFDNDIIRFLP
ncbi:hypothetical protein TVAG_435010 [Trichomonas vaginalis G3]|uniref:Cullin family profile domain-containing protein n=1 Tax=Trichomonas vaginalis (strain ATCC PRA-98 / G3) TaxID=412133 RepID=A2FYT2_TRIV3|nr:Cullin homology domain family [Trichomonas vaginalis G3]EAX89934.1 hypothetical protein TVAG_435010 [Trichomonas vaginalis G3]KAI5550224.1 Cullin homology domain family [Trichomonas vaginalis G3]|eukprot:XP_001302864.1 hypothetical protein [Trichomonas vaginalis G3]